MRLLLPLLLVVFLIPVASGKVVSGTLTGVVTVKAAKKPKRPSRYYLGPYRSARTRKTDRKTGPQDVVVYLEGLEAGRTTSTASPLPVMSQKGEAFVPRVLPVLAGTTVDFPNLDDFYHNVFSVMAGDRFDLGRYAKGKTARETFSRPGVVVVRCEIHAGMKAFILVLETPTFAVPADDGTFSFADIPPGRYTLKAWHPSHGERSRKVVVPESGTAEADFSF